MNSDIGPVKLDDTGATVGVVRLDPNRSYPEIGKLLQKVIRENDPDAWSEIKKRIDYTYLQMDRALSALDRSEAFSRVVKARVEARQKLLFKLNGVAIESISPYTLLPFPGSYANTEWAFVAAAMRWFHDKLGISYYRMCAGEAAVQSSTRAAQYTCIKKTECPVTTEAVYEGRSEDFYGGWGFYFARRYLAEASDPSLGDDPMRGYEESVSGTYLAPGDAGNRLMLYDLNKVSDPASKGRDVPVPGGENFKSILLHKVITGGDPDDPEDRKKYPGSVLINLPKLKVHTQALFTNAIKNLGIGLYPMQATRKKAPCWEYATPYSEIPAIKCKIPHQVWVPQMDLDTLTPKKDGDGKYIVEKTGGLTATMLDIIKAVKYLDILTLHIVDAIEAVNRDHQGLGLGIAVPEGLIMAGCDAVALDLFCARYMFSNVGLKVAAEVDLDDGFGGRFPQKVPVAHLQNGAIETGTAYDCPLARDACLKKAGQMGLGSLDYHVAGWDDVTGNPLVSVQRRPGYLDNGRFRDIHTRTLYWGIYKLPWDLQKTFFSYLDAVDELENSRNKKMFLKAFDETGNGVVTYEEYGKKGVHSPTLFLGALYMSLKGAADESEAYRSYFALIAGPLRATGPDWNAEQHNYNREFFIGSVFAVAWVMSQMKKENADPFCPDRSFGNGRWPSFTLARDQYLRQVIYGWKYPEKIGVSSLLGSVFAYADYRFNSSWFIGNRFGAPDANGINAYFKALKNQEIDPLDFTLFVPKGYGADKDLVHISETDDPAKIFTAQFDKGRILWPDARGTRGQE